MNLCKLSPNYDETIHQVVCVASNSRRTLTKHWLSRLSSAADRPDGHGFSESESRSGATSSWLRFVGPQSKRVFATLRIHLLICRKLVVRNL